MPRVQLRVLGDHLGTCPGCGQRAPQRLVETSLRAGLSHVFARHAYAPPVARSATCSACGDTYPVRAGDGTPAAAERRARPSTGREWCYPGIATESARRRDDSVPRRVPA